MRTIYLKVLTRQELLFLFNLWHIPEVMRHADEFPRLRGWTKNDEPAVAWRICQEQRAQHGQSYTQLLVYQSESDANVDKSPAVPIGEAAILPLPEEYTFGEWQKPAKTRAIIGDIKLLLSRWGMGVGTAATHLVVFWAFQHADVDLFVVPPHRLNPAAARVYEKAGLRSFSGMRSYRGHRVMTLSREQNSQMENNAK